MYPEESIQRSEHGEIFKSRRFKPVYCVSVKECENML